MKETAADCIPHSSRSRKSLLRLLGVEVDQKEKETDKEIGNKENKENDEGEGKEGESKSSHEEKD